jgi:hypothetical protein
MEGWEAEIPKQMDLGPRHTVGIVQGREQGKAHLSKDGQDERMYTLPGHFPPFMCRPAESHYAGPCSPSLPDPWFVDIGAGDDWGASMLLIWDLDSSPGSALAPGLTPPFNLSGGMEGPQWAQWARAAGL